MEEIQEQQIPQKTKDLMDQQRGLEIISPGSPVVAFKIDDNTVAQPMSPSSAVDSSHLQVDGNPSTPTQKIRRMSGRQRSATKSVGGKWQQNIVTGQIIYKNHESYNLMRQIQMGLRISISDITPQKSRDVTLEDFVTTKWRFPTQGSTRTPPHEHGNFRFYDYCSLPFKKLRERFGIEVPHFLLSLCHDKSLSILGTPGKSGALFFFSADMQYILKTITKKESKFFRKILPDYYNHIMNNPSSLITRYYGMYSIKPQVGKNVRFIIMNNVFDTVFRVDERYDLKGSTVGRKASPEDLKKPTPILKDLDLVERKPPYILLDVEMRQKLFEQLDNDCKFLEHCKIMDYSLLMGIHKVSEDDVYYLKQDQPLDQHGISSTASSSSTQGPSSQLLATEDDVTHSDRTTLTSDSTGTPTSVQHTPPTIQVKVVEENVSESGIKKSKPTNSPNTTTSTPGANKRNTLFKRASKDKTLVQQYHGPRVSQFQQFYGGMLSANGREIYFMGVIDILQVWNSRKQLENVFKGFQYDRSKISAVSPKNYAHRFVEYLNAHVKTP